LQFSNRQSEFPTACLQTTEYFRLKICSMLNSFIVPVNFSKIRNIYFRICIVKKISEKKIFRQAEISKRAIISLTSAMTP